MRLRLFAAIAGKLVSVLFVCFRIMVTSTGLFA